MRYLLSLLLTLFFIANDIIGQDNAIKGYIKEKKYYNNFLGWEMELPEGWKAINDELRDEWVKIGKEATKWENVNYKKSIRLFAFNHPNKSRWIGFTSSIDSLKKYPQFKTVEDYANLFEKGLKDAFKNEKYISKGEVKQSRKTIGGENFICVSHQHYQDGAMRYGEMYVKFVNEFAFSIGINYINDEEKSAIYNSLFNSKFSFKNNRNENDSVVVEVAPQFPGGTAGFYDYLKKEIKYPKRARKDKIEGKVFLNFIVTETGAIDSARVIKSLHPDIDKEALRVINKMPKWKPGSQNGKNVKVHFNLPMSFKL